LLPFPLYRFIFSLLQVLVVVDLGYILYPSGISISNSLALASKSSALVFPKIFYFSASIGISLVSTLPSSPVFFTFKVGVVFVVVSDLAVVLVIPALFNTELDVSTPLAFIAVRSTRLPLFN
jgi:hypothetical protein